MPFLILDANEGPDASVRAKPIADRAEAIRRCEAANAGRLPAVRSLYVAEIVPITAPAVQR